MRKHTVEKDSKVVLELRKGTSAVFFCDFHSTKSSDHTLVLILSILFCMQHCWQPFVPLVAKIHPLQLSHPYDCSFSNFFLGFPLYPHLQCSPEHQPQFCLSYTCFLDGFSLVFPPCLNHHHISTASTNLWLKLQAHLSSCPPSISAWLSHRQLTHIMPQMEFFVSSSSAAPQSLLLSVSNFINS